MKINLLALLILVSQCMAADTDYVVKMIDCEPKDEILISQTYESFLDLIAKREVKKEELRFPVKLATQNDKGVIFSHSFYISPNELRGFEIFIPKDCFKEENELFISTVGLAVDREETRQGIRCLELKRAQAVDIKPPYTIPKGRSDIDIRSVESVLKIGISDRDLKIKLNTIPLTRMDYVVYSLADGYLATPSYKDDNSKVTQWKTEPIGEPIVIDFDSQAEQDAVPSDGDKPQK